MVPRVSKRLASWLFCLQRTRIYRWATVGSYDALLHFSHVLFHVHKAPFTQPNKRSFLYMEFFFVLFLGVFCLFVSGWVFLCVWVLFLFFFSFNENENSKLWSSQESGTLMSGQGTWTAALGTHTHQGLQSMSRLVANQALLVRGSKNLLVICHTRPNKCSCFTTSANSWRKQIEFS